MSYIYKITNNINNKIYIGKTNNTLEQRFKEHCLDSVKHKERPLYRAFNKYGIKNFSIEPVEECAPEQASDREIYWIEYYGSFKKGYNATQGGDGKPYLDYDLIYQTYNQVKSCTKTAELCNCSEDSVRTIIKLKGISQETIKENARINRSKMVAMVDRQTQEIIKVFTSTKEAGKYLGKTPQHIQDVCNEKRKSAYGYFWKYLKE